MEVQRIYCAEQIVIPPTLGDIMKAYTKDVIRQTNENTSTKQLLEFSYQYFARLAQDTSGGRVNTGMLAALRGKISLHDTQMTGLLKFEDLQSLCNQASLPESDMEKCLRLANYQGGPIDWNEFIVLACTLLAEDRTGVVKAILQVYDENGTQSISYHRFITLFKYISKVDSAVSEDFIENMSTYFKRIGVNVNIEEYQNFVDSR